MTERRCLVGRLQQIYYKTPLAVQNLMISVYGSYLKRLRYGRHYRAHFAFLRQFETLPRDRQLAYQLEELRKLVGHARANSPFYARLYRDIDPEALRTPEDIRLLPVLTKELLRANMQEIYCIPRRGALSFSTGGTTGTPMQLLFRKEDMERRMAVLDYFRAKAGFVNMKMRKASFNSRTIVDAASGPKAFSRYNHAMRQRIYSAYHLSPKTAPAYLDDLDRFAPHALEGYMASILELAEHMLRTGRKPAYRPVAVFPTSETLTPYARETIEAAFGARVYDQYASSEGAPFITECPCGRLHYETSTGIFEQTGDSDEVLVTSFSTYGTPLIRYQIGDCVEMEPAGPDFVCECGSRLPPVRSIVGRKTSFLYAANGAKVTEAMASCLLKHVPAGIVRTQLVQEERGAMQVRIVRDRTYRTDYEEILRADIRELMGDEMRLEIRYVEEIPKTPSGKFLFIVNNLPPE